MQDYNYIWHGCMEITLELSCCKFPPASELPKFWEDNRASLLQFIGEAHRGVKGFVKDENAVSIEGASMKVLRALSKMHPTLERNCIKRNVRVVKLICQNSPAAFSLLDSVIPSLTYAHSR